MYILEGNTGIGKSTFLKLLNKHCPEISVIPEPKDTWTSALDGESLLSNFYKDPARWAYTMETLTMKYRVKEHLKEQAHKNPSRVMERSIYSGHYCFAKNGKAQGFFNPIEWNVYSTWVDFLLKNQCNAPLGFIYLKADPEVCLERIRKRNRLGEENITLEYMKQIDDLHEKFLVEKIDLFEALKNVPMITIDCNQAFAEDEDLMREHAQRVRDFMKPKKN